MAKGFMYISRDRIDEFEWLSNPHTFYVFMRLLFKAKFKDTKWEGIEIKRGQLVIGRKALGEELNLSEQQIRTCLDKLSKSGYITIQPTNRYSIVSICEYDSWQSDRCLGNQPNNQQITNNQPTNNQQITIEEINKEIEELKKENNKLKEELAKASEKKKKNAPVRKSLGGKAQDLFVGFYKEKGLSDTEYYWSPKDGSNMKQLLAKISSARESKGMLCDDDSMLSALKSLLESITDKWILEHFDVSNINSKYNEIVASAKNSGYKSGMDVGRIVQYDKSKFEGVTSENFFKK